MIPIGSDCLLTLSGLLNHQTGLYQNAATVTGTITDISQLIVYDTFSMLHVTSSNGNYQAIIPASVTSSIPDNTQVIVQVQAVQSGNTLTLQQTNLAVTG